MTIRGPLEESANTYQHSLHVLVSLFAQFSERDHHQHSHSWSLFFGPTMNIISGHRDSASDLYPSIGLCISWWLTGWMMTTTTTIELSFWLVQKIQSIMNERSWCCHCCGAILCRCICTVTGDDEDENDIQEGYTVNKLEAVQIQLEVSTMDFLTSQH